MTGDEARLWGWLDPGPRRSDRRQAGGRSLAGRQARAGSADADAAAAVRRRNAHVSRSLPPRCGARSTSAVGADEVSDDLVARTVRSLGQSYPDQLERRAGRIARCRRRGGVSGDRRGGSRSARRSRAQPLSRDPARRRHQRGRRLRRRARRAALGDRRPVADGPHPDALEDRPHSHGRRRALR